MFSFVTSLIAQSDVFKIQHFVNLESFLSTFWMSMHSWARTVANNKQTEAGASVIFFFVFAFYNNHKHPK